MNIKEFVLASGQALPVLNFGTPDWSIYVRSASLIVTDADAIRQNLEIIGSTILGSDPLRPEFGAMEGDEVDMPINVVGPPLIAKISRACATYEKRAKVLSVRPTLNTDNGQVLMVITFTIINQPGAQAETVTFAIQ